MLDHFPNMFRFGQNAVNCNFCEKLKNRKIEEKKFELFSAQCNFLGYRVQAKIFESVDDHPIYTYSLTLPPTYRSHKHSWTLTHPRKPFSKPPSPSPAYSWASNSNRLSSPTATASVIPAPPLCQQSHTKGHHVYMYQTIDGQQMFVYGQIDSWIWRM